MTRPSRCEERPQSRVHRLRRRGKQQLRRREAAKRGSVPCLRSARLRGGLLGRRLTLRRLSRRSERRGIQACSSVLLWHQSLALDGVMTLFRVLRAPSRMDSHAGLPAGLRFGGQMDVNFAKSLHSFTVVYTLKTKVYSGLHLVRHRFTLVYT